MNNAYKENIDFSFPYAEYTISIGFISGLYGAPKKILSVYRY